MQIFQVQSLSVKFYNNFYNSASELPSKATRTWVLQTKKLGNDYTVQFDDTHKVQVMISIED